MNRVKKFFKRTFRRISRTLAYTRLGWRLYDYDYHSAIEVFQYQLTRIADFLESDSAYAQNALQEARRIRTAVELLKKVYEEEYGMEYQEIIRKKYGESALDFNFTEELIDDIEGDGDERVLFRLGYKFETYPNAEEIRKEMNVLFKKSYDKQEKAHRLVWRFIEHNIRGWWD